MRLPFSWRKNDYQANNDEGLDSNIDWPIAATEIRAETTLYLGRLRTNLLANIFGLLALVNSWKDSEVGRDWILTINLIEEDLEDLEDFIEVVLYLRGVKVVCFYSSLGLLFCFCRLMTIGVLLGLYTYRVHGTIVIVCAIRFFLRKTKPKISCFWTKTWRKLHPTHRIAVSILSWRDMTSIFNLIRIDQFNATINRSTSWYHSDKSQPPQERHDLISIESY